MTAVTCKHCQVVGEWGKLDNRWVIFQDGKPHVCNPPDTEEAKTPNLDFGPVERSETQLLARQVARLATAVENLTAALLERPA